MINVLHGNASIFVNQFQTAFHFQCNQFNSITFDDGLDPAAAGWIHPLNPAWIGGKYQSMEQLLMFECKCFGHSVEYWMLFSRKFSPLFRLLLFGPIPVCVLANNKPNQGLVKKMKKPPPKKKNVSNDEFFVLKLFFFFFFFFDVLLLAVAFGVVGTCVFMQFMDTESRSIPAGLAAEEWSDPPPRPSHPPRVSLSFISLFFHLDVVKLWILCRYTLVKM